MKAWHFLRDNGNVRDGRKAPPDGVWLEHEGDLMLCVKGLHASVLPFDALWYAPGALICRVELGGEIAKDSDKVVASRRKILWRADATDTLKRFARLCAKDVAHLWDAPKVVLNYLRTGDESLRDAAEAAARAAAWASAEDAARSAAWAAARAAAGGAAWDAARDAARAAAREAAWASAEDAARAAAWEEAWEEAKAKQNRRLHRMLMKLRGDQ